MQKWGDDIHNVPTYPVADAARYLRIPLVTLRSWLKGSSDPTKTHQQAFEALIRRPSSTSPHLSFTNLVEAHVLRIIRETHRVKLAKVRYALDYLNQQLNTHHPLVSKKFQTDGVDLFVDQMDKLVNVSRSGQLAMRAILNHLLARVEWDENGLATRFFPINELISNLESDKVIFLDPAIRFGKPVIAETGVPTRIIAELYNAGDSIEDIADEYDCTPSQVFTAIQFESQSLTA